MSDVLLATDADWLFDDVTAALGGSHDVHRVREGTEVAAAVSEVEPNLIILDLQIGNMGGVAASLDLRHEAEAGRSPEVKILMLLDRDIDNWIAAEAKADLELVKPADAFRLRKAANSLLQPVAAD